MATTLGLLTIGDLRGGRNNVDSPLIIGEDQVVEAINVDWYQGLLCRRRTGAASISIGGGLTGRIVKLIRHLPTTLESQSELWAVDDAGNVARQVAGVWSSVTLLDKSAATIPSRIYGASFNGKLFLGYASSVNRYHVWDGTQVRRCGITFPPAPSVAAGAAGTITGTRYYKVAYTTQVTGVTTRRSELNTSPASLAIASKTGWVVTRGALVSEGETHWELYGGTTATGPFYYITTLPVATTSYTDTVATFPPTGASIAPVININTLIPTAKYVMVDQARLILAGSWDPSYSGLYQSRIWWTPVLNDASGVGNDERLDFSISPFIDFEPGDGGEITGLGGPLFDCPFIFKLDRIYKIVRTGTGAAPYRPVTITKKCGAIRQDTIVSAEDEAGSECLYFLSRRGPYRIGQQGLQYCGRDIEDLWARVPLDIASGDLGAHGIYHSDLKQIWWWVPLDASSKCVLKLVFDVKQGRWDTTTGVRRGWSIHDGLSASANASVSYARTIGATNSLTLAPYIGQDATGQLWRCDVSPNSDNGTPYRAYVRTRIYMPGQSMAEHGGILEGHLVLLPTTAPLRVSTIRDFGLEVRNADITPAPVGGETRMIVPLRDLAAVSTAALQIEMGDPSAQTVAWTLDQLVLRVRKEENR